MGFKERCMYYWYEEPQAFLANGPDSKTVSIDIFTETMGSNACDGWKRAG